MKKTIRRILFLIVLVISGLVAVSNTEFFLSPSSLSSNYIIAFLTGTLVFVEGMIIGLVILVALICTGHVAEWLLPVVLFTNNKENPIDK